MLKGITDYGKSLRDGDASVMCSALTEAWNVPAMTGHLLVGQTRTTAILKNVTYPMCD